MEFDENEGDGKDGADEGCSLMEHKYRWWNTIYFKQSSG